MICSTLHVVSHVPSRLAKCKLSGRKLGIKTHSRTSQYLNTQNITFMIIVTTYTSRLPTVLLLGSGTKAQMCTGAYCHSSILASELQKTSSPELEPRTNFFRLRDLCAHNLLLDRSNFCLGTVLLSFLDPNLQKLSSL
jgi:hypothetical protein